MTYISAFKCANGIVLCADTQETVDDEKQYVEKLYAAQNLSYPIAIGGAGLDEPIEAFCQETLERVGKEKPATGVELGNLLRAVILEVYRDDAVISAWPEAYRTTKYIIAAKPPNDAFVIFKIVGKRVYRQDDPVIIGYETAANAALLKRMYRNDLPAQQAVMLAIYLLSQSKARDVGVGGDSRVVVVTNNGAWIDDSEYVKQAEAYIAKFLELTDSLFLNCVDVSIAPSNFPEKLQQFVADAVEQRQQFANYSSLRSFQRMSEPGFQGDAYDKIFLGAVQVISGAGFEPVREETQEEIDRRRAMIEAAEKAVNKIEASKKFAELTQGKQFTAIFDVWIHGRGGLPS